MKISIVFEEGPNEKGDVTFNVYLDGITEHRRKVIDSMTPELQLQELSTAEFWALRCFQITINAMVQSGAFRSTKKKENTNE